jgi:hypothetical protein
VPICRREANRNRRYINQCTIFPEDSHNHYFPLAYIPHGKNTPKKQTYFYMYNLKLVSKTEKELKKQMQKVRTFSDDICMEFRLDKCTKTVLKNGKSIHSQNLMIDINREI